MAYKVPVLRDVEKDVDPYALEILASRFSTAMKRRVSRSSLIREQRPGGFGRGRLRLDRARSRDCSICRARRARAGRVPNSKPASAPRSRASIKDGVDATMNWHASRRTAGGQPDLQARFNVRPGHGNRPARNGRNLLPARTSGSSRNLQSVSAEQVQGGGSEAICGDEQLTIGRTRPAAPAEEQVAFLAGALERTSG